MQISHDRAVSKILPVLPTWAVSQAPPPSPSHAEAAPPFSPSVVPGNRPRGLSHLIAHEASDRAWHHWEPGNLWFLELLDTQRKLPTNVKALPMSCHPMYLSYVCLQSVTRHIGHSSLLCSQTWRHSSETRNMSSLHYGSAIPTQNIPIFTLRSRLRRKCWFWLWILFQFIIFQDVFYLVDISCTKCCSSFTNRTK